MLKKILLFFSLIVISTAGICNVTNQKLIRSSPEEIRKILLQNTPLGISMEQVVAYCQNKKIPYTISTKSGYLDQEHHIVVGSQSVRGQFGEYKESIFVTASVSAFWGFNEQGKLIEIWVWKTFDSL
jgi:hypothetical protein